MKFAGLSSEVNVVPKDEGILEPQSEPSRVDCKLNEPEATSFLTVRFLVFEKKPKVISVSQSGRNAPDCSVAGMLGNFVELSVVDGVDPSQEAIRDADTQVYHLDGNASLARG